MLSVELTDALERRLSDLARERGQTDADLARELIESAIEDIDDAMMASRRLVDRRPSLSSDKAFKALI